MLLIVIFKGKDSQMKLKLSFYLKYEGRYIIYSAPLKPHENTASMSVMNNCWNTCSGEHEKRDLDVELLVKWFQVVITYSFRFRHSTREIKVANNVKQAVVLVLARVLEVMDNLFCQFPHPSSILCLSTQRLLCNLQETANYNHVKWKSITQSSVCFR